MKKELKLAGLALVLGMLLTRVGQHALQAAFEGCIANSKAPTTIQELIQLQNKCMPPKILIRIFFW